MSSETTHSELHAGIAAVSDGKIVGTEIPTGVKRTKETKGNLTDIITITPELAKTYLESQTINRPLNASNLRYLVSEIKEGKFELTGESIKFDVNGNLRDGQHRCTAIIDSEMEVDVEVIGGLAPETIDIMDTGQSRTISDMLHIDGVSQASKVANIVKYVMRLESDYYQKESELIRQFPDNRDARKFASNNAKKLKEVTEEAVNYTKQAANAKATPVAYVATMLYYLSKFDEKGAEEFVYSLVTHSFAPTDPQSVLFAWLQDCADIQKRNVTCNELLKMSAWIKTFDAFLNNKPLTKRTMILNPLKEEFPSVELTVLS